jgi:hypothetical protein
MKRYRLVLTDFILRHKRIGLIAYRHNFIWHNSQSTTSYPRVSSGHQDVTPFDVYRFVLIGMMAIMFVLTTVISAVFARISASKLLSTGQRQQSMVATVVMVLYMITYCSFTALQLIMYTTCPDDTLGYEVVDWLLNHIKLCLYAINPILLCLRMKSVRTSLYRFICMKGKSKKSN